MKKYTVSFQNIWGVENDTTDEQMYNMFLDYLEKCVRNRDVTAFDFKVNEDVISR